jgi:hypothetical protein
MSGSMWMSITDAGLALAHRRVLCRRYPGRAAHSDHYSANGLIARIMINQNPRKIRCEQCVSKTSLGTHPFFDLIGTQKRAARS